MTIVVSLLLAIFVAAVIAFIWTGVRGALGHYDPASLRPAYASATDSPGVITENAI